MQSAEEAVAYHEQGSASVAPSFANEKEVRDVDQRHLLQSTEFV